MIRRTLEFTLWPVQVPESPAESEKWKKRVFPGVEALAKKHSIFDDFEISMDSTNLGRLTRLVESLNKQGLARMHDGTLKEEVVADKAEELDWFEVRSHEDFIQLMAAGYHGLCKLRGGTPSTSCHVLSGRCVSQEVKTFVENHRLSGVEFVWLKTGRRGARQWYMPIAQRPLGRGLDHPWFNHKRLLTWRWPGCSQKREISKRWRSGIVDGLFMADMKPDSGYGDATQDRLLSLFAPDQLRINSYPRFLRKYLPSTDFAFYWSGTDEWMTFSGGLRELGNRRELCVNRKAADLLIAAKLLSPDQLVPILVLEKPWPGARVLDRIPGGPGPLFSGAALRRLRQEETEAIALYQRQLGHHRRSSAQRWLDQLRQYRALEPKKFGPPATAIELKKLEQALGRTVPGLWARVLQEVGGGTIESEVAGPGACRIVPARELPKFHSQQAQYFRDIDSGFSEHFLHVIATDCGDAFCLDTSRVNADGDCPVALVSHETGMIERRWSSVEKFMTRLLASR
jgi:hypothetical protein